MKRIYLIRSSSPSAFPNVYLYVPYYINSLEEIRAAETEVLEEAVDLCIYDKLSHLYNDRTYLLVGDLVMYQADLLVKSKDFTYTLPLSAPNEVLEIYKEGMSIIIDEQYNRDNDGLPVQRIPKFARILEYNSTFQ